MSTLHQIRRVCAVLVLAFPGLFLNGQQKAYPSNSVKIGFLMDSLKVERWQTDLDRFQKRAAELGANVLVETADGDDELQLRQAQKLLDSGVKALVLVPHDADKAVRIVSAAKAKQVPLLCYERLVRNADVTFFIGVDASAVGYLQAYFLSQRAPKGNYVLIGGSPSDINAKILHDAQMGVLKPMVDRGDIKIVSDTWTKDWEPSEAYAHMSAAIDSTKGNIVAVVASNDGTAGGAIQALEEHKLAGKVFVSGQDADLAAIIRILDRVIRRFLGDRNIMRVALGHAGGGDAAEPGIPPEAVDVLGPAVAHAGPEAADELINEVGQRPSVRHAALDALGHELLRLLHARLAVAVGRDADER